MAFNSLDMPGIVKGQGSGFGDFLTDAVNWIGDTFFGGSHHTNEVNQEIAQQNIDFQKWANEQNIAFQTEQNNITRQREDNAVQRAAADMEAAGLSKTLAAGNPASAQALTAPQVEAPNNSFKMERNLAGMNFANMVSDIVFKAKEAKRAKELNDAQIANINADTAGKNISNEFARDKLIADIAFTTASTEQTKALTDLYKIQADVEQKLGPLKVEKMQEEIEKLIVDEDFIKQQTNTEIWKQLNYRSGIMLNDSQMTLLAHQIANEACKNLNIKQEYNNLVAEYTYKMLQAKALLHDIGYAEKTGLPVGSMAGGLFGGMLNTGISLRNMMRSWLGERSFADWETVPAFTFNGGSGYTSMPSGWIGSSGGGSAW